MTSRLTVITGPTGVDIGPVAARLGRTLDDGLAIRVVAEGGHPHTSPDPHHRVGGSIRAVRLGCLPSAWQNPDTNLGVAYAYVPGGSVLDDMRTLDALGLNPGHRLTLQYTPATTPPSWIPPYVEIGKLATIARDSVLRAGGRVQVEAGNGQTFLSALATVGIPPWAEWIGHLDRWIVLDAAAPTVGIPDGALADYLPGAVQAAVNDLDGSSGAYGMQGDTRTLRVALLNGQMLVPGIAAHDYDTRTGVGDEPPADADEALANLLDAVHEKTGVEIALIGTGHITGTGVWSWIDSGESI